jgi:3-isopropylmalate dehydrogenase
MYKIAVVPGDGTGPEVVAEGLKVLKAASEKYGFKYNEIHYDLGGERYLKQTLPDLSEELRRMDAIYLKDCHPEVKPEF